MKRQLLRRRFRCRGTALRSAGFCGPAARGQREAQSELTELRRAAREHQRVNQNLVQSASKLAERVKELNCLYTISAIAERRDLSLEELVQGTAEAVPVAWQYPEVCSCRIRIGGQTFQTAGFDVSPWGQSQPINWAGAEVGSVEVYYAEERPVADEGPFLKEERSLIRLIAVRLGETVERHQAQQLADETNAKNQALLGAIPDLIFQLHPDGTLLGFHAGDYVGWVPLLSEYVGRSLGPLFGDQGRIPARIWERGLLQVRRAVATGETQVFEEHVLIGAASHFFEIRLVVMAETAVLGMLRDITARKRLEREILEISGREQRRIGRDLHDSLCQHLAGVGFLAKALARKASGGTPGISEDAGEIVDLIDEAITLTRGLARGLNPVRLESDGLISGLQELAAFTQKLFGVTCRFEHAGAVCGWFGAPTLELYRIAQEAVNNAMKHAAASNILIRLEMGPEANMLIVKDDGIGFSRAATQGKGMGLSIMKYRALMIGASVEIRDGLDGGTLVCCRFPFSGAV